MHLNGSSSSHELSHAVPLESLLGAVLFTLYILPLGNTVGKRSIHFHCYAADSLSMKQEGTNHLI